MVERNLVREIAELLVLAAKDLDRVKLANDAGLKAILVLPLGVYQRLSNANQETHSPGRRPMVRGGPQTPLET
jgi:hypothetical protein